MWRIKTTKDGIWLGRWILHSATQLHPFSTLPWDDQYLLFPGMTNTLYTIGPLIKVSERGKTPQFGTETGRRSYGARNAALASSRLSASMSPRRSAGGRMTEKMSEYTLV